MLSHEALRQAAQTTPAVLVDSAQLLELLDALDKVKSKTKAVREARQTDPNDEKCARWLFDVLRRTAPKAKEPNFTAWVREVRLMRERDDRTHKEICALFLWAHQDNFWCGNILSPTKLREHWDRLAIQRDKAAEVKKTGGGAWWASDATRLAKAIEVGVGPALGGESKDSYEARIRAAIDNGGKPPAPVVHVRPSPAPLPAHVQAAAEQATEQPRRTGRPEGLVKMMQQLGRAVPTEQAA